MSAMPSSRPTAAGWLTRSNESGEHEIYIRPFPIVEGEREQVSNAGGFKPLWSARWPANSSTLRASHRPGSLGY